MRLRHQCRMVTSRSSSFAIFIPLFGLAILLSCKPKVVEQSEAQSQIADSTATDSLTTRIHWSEESEMLGLGIPHGGDLDSLVKRRVIRALVPYSRTYYQIDGQERRGIAYDAFNAFEQYLNKELGFSPPHVRIVFIPASHDQLLSLLEDGYGDVALGGITILEERKTRVDFSLPTQTGIKQVVVAGPTAAPLNSLADLSGKPVYVYKHGSYAQSLRRLNDSLQRIMLPPVQILSVDEYLSVEDILEMVGAGHLPYTIAEDDVALYWSTQFDSLRVYENLVVRSNASFGCAMRKGTPKLKAMVDKFAKTHAKGSQFGNMTYNRYLGKARHKSHMRPGASPEMIRKLQGHFVEYANRYQLDWLLLMAQAYQESRFDNNAVSSAGAVGIMQVKPSTAAGKPINIRDVRKLENNIHAGAKYDRHLIDQYFPDTSMDKLNQQLFALAAYNAGPGRIAQLRKMAKARRLDANIWFNQVEMVAAKEIGRETVQYVSNIYKYYISFSALRSYQQTTGKTVWPTGAPIP